MCLPAPKGRPSKNNPTPVMAEFCHQLLTAHQTEASRAFVPLVALLESVLDDAAKSGDVPSGLNHAEVAGVILSTIMFNAAYAHTISGSEEPADGDHAATPALGIPLGRPRDPPAGRLNAEEELSPGARARRRRGTRGSVRPRP